MSINHTARCLIALCFPPIAGTTACAQQLPLRTEVDALRAKPELAAYHGWLDYLLHRTEVGPGRADRDDLDDWVRQLQHGEDLLPSKRGYFEWAYLSHVDGRGQPFVLGVPDAYDPSRSWPLEINLHGYGGSHVSHAPQSEQNPNDYFQLYVLGRAQGGGYLGLGEVDVLEAIDFVSRHWNIAEDQHHLLGGSMGASGVLRIAMRHPHRFASARPLAVSGIEFPMENLINMPVLAIHGGFDEIIPQVMMRSPLERLRANGAMAAWYVDDAHGHAARNSKPTMGDFRRLAFQHRRILDVSHIRYTAVDEVARRAYWARVDEWGPAGRPATLNLRMSRANTLFASIDNADVVAIDLTLAPVDRSQPLTVVFDGQLPQIHPAPLPERLYLVRFTTDPAATLWSVQAERPEQPEFRLHAPGGARLLYSGEPLLIVYGTTAWAERNEALRKAAELAAFSPIGSWPPDEPKRDGWPAYYMPYGRHAVKADHEVTDEDMQRYNLLVLGDPRHNAIIKRIQKQLPVRLNGTHIRTDDGHAWRFEGSIFGLLHYNPLAPKRLLYWVAASETEDYGPGTMSPVTTLMDMQAKLTAPADFIVLGDAQADLLAARRFDSRWRWESGYAESSSFSESVQVIGPHAEILARTIRKTVGTDFSLTRGRDWSSMQLWARAGVTRLADVRAMFYDERAAKMTLNGGELLDLHEQLARRAAATQPMSHSDWRNIGEFHPDPATVDIDSTVTYTVSFPAWEIFSIARYTTTDTASFTMTDVTLREAWARHAQDLLGSQDPLH